MHRVKSHFISKCGKSDPHLFIDLLNQQVTFLWEKKRIYNIFMGEKQDFIIVLQSNVGKHFGICCA